MPADREIDSKTKKVSDQSLREQMHISDREIARRKQLLAFADNDVQHLRHVQPFIAGRIDTIVDDFYVEQTSIDEVDLLIGDADTLTRLRAAMRRYILELFNGEYDAAYVNSRLRIGLVHSRIGVPPKLYLSGVRILSSLLSQVIRWESASSQNDPVIFERLDAVQKIILFDVELVFDTYIRGLVAEVETTKNEIEVYAGGLEEVVAARTRQLEQLSRTDDLTGLYNKRAFHEHLRRELAIVERGTETLCLAFLDLDGVKQLNDTMGHAAGDTVLTLVGSIVSESIRQGDIPCRIGGDEFCIIMPRTLLDDAKAICDRLCFRFADSCEQDITFSIGIVQSASAEKIDLQDFVKHADQLMYQAKTESGFSIRSELSESGDDDVPTEPVAATGAD
jgi:diguanylate cyclase (GGDEF)-like protein